MEQLLASLLQGREADSSRITERWLGHPSSALSLHAHMSREVTRHHNIRRGFIS